MLFSKLCEEFDRIEVTSKRLEKSEILRQLLMQAEAGEVAQLVNLALGQLRPKYDRLEFAVAEKMIIRAVAQTLATSTDVVMARYKTKGDLGEVIENEQINKLTNEKMQVSEVYEELEKIARASGTGSQERKVAGLSRLMGSVTGKEAKYIVRMVLSKLRLGFSDKTILDVLSILDRGSKEARTRLDAMYQVAPDVAELARLVKEKGVEEAEREVKIELGRPILPALAQRLTSATEMIEKMGKVMVEPKYDGTRVQIHWARERQEERLERQGGLFGAEVQVGEWVRTFTRNLDENSGQFPELARMGEQVAAKELILDCEAVGVDPKTGKMMPFQLTITRKRKHGVGETASAVPLKFFVFDVLYHDGQELLKLPLRERRRILQEIIGEGEVLVVDESITTEDPEELREYHRQKLAQGYEGVVIKQVEGEYKPGRQGWNWVKFKEEEGQAGKLTDTLDVVVMGYYRGKGKRSEFGLGAFLVGVRRGEEIVTIAKIGTGLSDAQFRQMNARLQQCESEKMPTQYVVDKSLIPDEWVEPSVVVEVAADEITRSPAHSSSYALRFPRLVRVREDKDLSGVTEVGEVEEIAGIV